jgi:hypothetical protein
MKRTNYTLRLALRISNTRCEALSAQPWAQCRIESASCWRPSQSVNPNPNHIKPFDGHTCANRPVRAFRQTPIFRVLPIDGVSDDRYDDYADAASPRSCYALCHRALASSLRCGRIPG